MGKQPRLSWLLTWVRLGQKSSHHFYLKDDEVGFLVEKKKLS